MTQVYTRATAGTHLVIYAVGVGRTGCFSAASKALATVVMGVEDAEFWPTGVKMTCCIDQPRKVWSHVWKNGRATESSMNGGRKTTRSLRPTFMHTPLSP
ncbi:hypothetical protein H2248_008084 [Termitomyces sp. 'cryptogamus']|nr:hypothetical protein H2248_008084 [Termitomyces sp. 'cryptogamus']